MNRRDIRMATGVATPAWVLDQRALAEPDPDFASTMPSSISLTYYLRAEGFIIEQLLAQLPKARAYYWRTQAGAELDLLLFLKRHRIGIGN